MKRHEASALVTVIRVVVDDHQFGSNGSRANNLVSSPKFPQMYLTRLISGGASLRPVATLRRPAQLIVTSRSLHATNVYYKKKPNARNDEDDDAFGAEEEEGDLFASPSESQTQTKTDLTSPALAAQTANIAAKRAAHFQQSKEKLMSHPAYAAAIALRKQNPDKDINLVITPDHKKPERIKLKHAPARANLALMTAWASTRAELLEIVDVFRVYRAKQWPIDELNRIDFIGRCRSLKAPDIALAVLYHRPKFGIDIPSLSSARVLMHSLLITPCPPPGAEGTPLPEDIALPTSTPLSHALLLANLFDMYALPPAETDEVTRALLLGGCIQQLRKGGDVEDANNFIQKARDWAETQKTPEKAEGILLDGKDPRVKDGKLAATSKALKEKGKIPPNVVLPEDVPLYSNELTVSERTWIKSRLNKVVRWAQDEGQDASWVEKLRVAAA